MGYLGLDRVNDSDMAFDLASVCVDTLAKCLKRGLRESGNEYNTCGVTNVALFNELIIYPIRKEIGDLMNENLLAVLCDCKEKLRKLIKRSSKACWDDEGNKLMHLKAYKRMLKKLEITTKALSRRILIL